MPVVLKKLFTPFFQLLYRWYASGERNYRYGEMQAKILPGVFVPRFTFSTKILLEFITRLPLENKTFLELGSGTGVISVWAAMRKARVTACDINPAAVKNTTLNARLNEVKVNAVVSDLFSALSGEQFDYIVINPPFYPRDPETDAEKAWYCGREFGYFENLFPSLPSRLAQKGKAFMILSEDCDIGKIRAIATKHRVEMTEVEEIKRWWERNYIFRLSPVQ